MEQDPLIANADPEHLTCLRARETFGITQQHDLTLSFGELLDRRSQDRRPRGRIEPGLSVVRPRRQRICPLSLSIKARRIHGMDVLKRYGRVFPSTRRAGPVDEDPKEPRLDRRPTLESVDPADDPHPCVLHRLLGHGRAGNLVDSGGVFPVSVAVHGNLVYVLNALNGRSVEGFVSFFGHLIPLPGSNRNLNLTIPSDGNQFTSTPGQVAFSPDGSQLIVTTKGSGHSVDVFDVGRFGELSASPVVNVEAGTVPFAVTFDAAGHLVVADAGTNALSTFSLNPDGTVSLLDTVGTGQKATCWVASAQGYLYASSAGSASLSGFQSAANGQLTLLSPVTATDPGTVDASASVGGQYLYVQTGGKGIVDEFLVNGNGSLSQIGSVTVAGAAGGEGIVAF